MQITKYLNIKFIKITFDNLWSWIYNLLTWYSIFARCDFPSNVFSDSPASIWLYFVTFRHILNVSYSDVFIWIFTIWKIEKHLRNPNYLIKYSTHFFFHSRYGTMGPVWKKTCLIVQYANLAKYRGNLQLCLRIKLTIVNFHNHTTDSCLDLIYCIVIPS